MPNGNFVFSLQALEKEPGSRLHVSRSGNIPGLKISTSFVPETQDIGIDVLLEAVHGGVLARGTVATKWFGECARCLEMATGVLTAEVGELFEPASDSETTYLLDGDEIDLEPMVRDACMLELPLKPLCKPQCRGLCATCGANLNESTCQCSEPKDDRWSVLDALKTMPVGEGGAVTG